LLSLQAAATLVAAAILTMRVVWVTGKYYVRQVLETLAKLEPLDAARRMTRGDRIIL